MFTKVENAVYYKLVRFTGHSQIIHISQFEEMFNLPQIIAENFINVREHKNYTLFDNLPDRLSIFAIKPSYLEHPSFLFDEEIFYMGKLLGINPKEKNKITQIVQDDFRRDILMISNQHKLYETK